MYVPTLLTGMIWSYMVICMLIPLTSFYVENFLDSTHFCQSPLGSFMGDLFMDLLESEVLNGGNPLTGHISYWYRYVDDVLRGGGPSKEINGFM